MNENRITYSIRAKMATRLEDQVFHRILSRFWNKTVFICRHPHIVVLRTVQDFSFDKKSKIV
jgi:hypothetical protein